MKYKVECNKHMAQLQVEVRVQLFLLDKKSICYAKTSM